MGPTLAGLVSAWPSSEELLTMLCSLCTAYPEAVSRECPTLLPALLQQAHSLSWSPHRLSSLASLTSLTPALTALVSADPAQARLLCHGIETVTVNPTFDGLVRDLQLCQ